MRRAPAFFSPRLGCQRGLAPGQRWYSRYRVPAPAAAPAHPRAHAAFAIVVIEVPVGIELICGAETMRAPRLSILFGCAKLSKVLNLGPLSYF